MISQAQLPTHLSGFLLPLFFRIISQCTQKKVTNQQSLEKYLSDKVYWQVADQPGKEGPNYLVMGDLVKKEEEVWLSSSRDRSRKKQETKETRYNSPYEVSWTRSYSRRAVWYDLIASHAAPKKSSGQAIA